MDTINVTTARKDFYDLVKNRDEPIKIAAKEANAVLISERDWESIEETLYLMGIPKMRNDLIEGMETPTEDLLTAEEVGFDV